MAEFFWFSDAQWARIAPLLPTNTRGKKRVDDRRVLSGIVQALKSGGRWAERGIWEAIFAALAGTQDAPDRLVIDSTCINVHRCAGGAKGGPLPMLLVARKAGATPSSTRSAMAKAGRASSS